MMRKRTNCPRWMYRREDSFMVHAAQSDTMAPGRMVLPALCLGSFITTLNFVAPAPFLPAMSRDLDVSVALLGQITAAMMILSAVLALVVGPVADRYGSRRFILIGLIATVVSLFDFALAPVFFLLFIASIAGSIAEATVPGLSLAIAGTRFHGPAARAVESGSGNRQREPGNGRFGNTARNARDEEQEKYRREREVEQAHDRSDQSDQDEPPRSVAIGDRTNHQRQHRAQDHHRRGDLPQERNADIQIPRHGGKKGRWRHEVECRECLL